MWVGWTPGGCGVRAEGCGQPQEPELGEPGLSNPGLGNPGLGNPGPGSPNPGSASNPSAGSRDPVTGVRGSG